MRWAEDSRSGFRGGTSGTRVNDFTLDADANPDLARGQALLWDICIALHGKHALGPFDLCM